MKIVVRNHKKDNLVTNRQNYASVLALSFLWNLRNYNTILIKFMKFFEKKTKNKTKQKKQWCQVKVINKKDNNTS